MVAMKTLGAHTTLFSVEVQAKQKLTHSLRRSKLPSIPYYLMRSDAAYATLVLLVTRPGNSQASKLYINSFTHT